MVRDIAFNPEGFAAGCSDRSGPNSALAYFDIERPIARETVEDWLPALLEQPPTAPQDADSMDNSTRKD